MHFIPLFFQMIISSPPKHLQAKLQATHNTNFLNVRENINVSLHVQYIFFPMIKNHSSQTMYFFVFVTQLQMFLVLFLIQSMYLLHQIIVKTKLKKQTDIFFI